MAAAAMVAAAMVAMAPAGAMAPAEGMAPARQTSQMATLGLTQQMATLGMNMGLVSLVLVVSFGFLFPTSGVVQPEKAPKCVETHTHTQNH